MGFHCTSKGSSRPRDQTQVSCIGGRFFTVCTTREALCHRAWPEKKKLNLKKAGLKKKTKQKNKAFSCPVLRFSVHPLAFLCLSPTGNSVALTYQSLDSEDPGPSRWRNLGFLPAPSEPRGRPGASVAAESSLDSPRSPGPCRSPGLTL